MMRTIVFNMQVSFVSPEHSSSVHMSAEEYGRIRRIRLFVEIGNRMVPLGEQKRAASM